MQKLFEHRQVSVDSAAVANADRQIWRLKYVVNSQSTEIFNFQIYDYFLDGTHKYVSLGDLES